MVWCSSRLRCVFLQPDPELGNRHIQCGTPQQPSAPARGTRRDPAHTKGLCHLRCRVCCVRGHAVMMRLSRGEIHAGCLSSSELGEFMKKSASSDATITSVSHLDRRQALRAGLLAGAGVVAAGVGLVTSAPAVADPGIQAWVAQEGWRFCSKCRGLFYLPFGAGRCPAGGGHSGSGSFPYFLWYNDVAMPSTLMQPEWRWCRKCQGMAYGGFGPGFCPGLGRHDHSGSGNYHMWHDVGPLLPGEQDNWRWCRKCQAIFYGPHQAQSWCAESGRHDGSGSFNYMIQFVTSAARIQSTRRPG